MKFWQNPAKAIRGFLKPESRAIVQNIDYQSDVLERDMRLDIYLPPGYDHHAELTYPLALFNDGQDLPRMKFLRLLDRMYEGHELPPVVIVGIHASDARMREYGTARQADYKGRGDEAAAYTEFIVSELLPFLYRHFRLSEETQDRAIAGFSLGGLSAFDIGWARPDLFGVIGAFSASFWWRWADVDPADPDACRIMHDIILDTDKADPDQWFWFQCGTRDEEEDRNNNGVIDAIDDTLDIIRALKTKGVRDEAIRYLEIEEGRHEPATWGQAMPDFLRWAFVDEE